MTKDHWELPSDYTSIGRADAISTLAAQIARLEARLIEVESLAANLAHQLKVQQHV